MTFQLEHADALLFAQDKQGGGFAGRFAKLLEHRSGNVDLVQPREPDVSKLHHAMRKAKPLRVALRLDQAGSCQGLQQPIERGPAKSNALLNLEDAERRLVGRKALQDGDGTVDRPDRRCRTFVLCQRVFGAH